MTYTIAWVDGQPVEEIEFGRSLLPEGIELVGTPGGCADQEWAALAGDADAFITRYARVGEAELAGAHRLGLIQKYGGREDGIDLDAARRAGVQVATMPLRGCVAVAECAMTLTLALSKQLIRAHRATVSGAYRDRGLAPELTSQRKHAFQWMALDGIFEVFGRRIGIVGFGEIGTEIASRAQAFGMDVVYTKRTRLEPHIEARLGVRWMPLEVLLGSSDVVVVAAPHTAETEGMIGADELGLMRETAVLVNISRGALVDEAALVSALRSHAIAGAGIDVYRAEPVPYDHPLLELDNVVLTPHIGGGTGGAREKQLSDVLNNIVRAANGETPQHLIQSEAINGA